MVWEHQTEMIVMLRDTSEEFYCYWSPIEGTTKVIGTLSIKTLKINDYATYKITYLLVTDKTGKKLKVTHMIYENWSAYNASDFLHFISIVQLNNLREFINEYTDGKHMYSEVPIVVHSSHSRATTFCTVDISMSRYIYENKYY